VAVAEANTDVVRIEPAAYAWHETQWATLTRDLSRLPHALLLFGQKGLGKNAFALRFARYLLCQNRSHADACGRCQSCSLFRVGNHPDLLRVGPQEDSANILVDQIRGVIEFLSLRPHTAANKIVVVSPAEAMNVSAANSLLKNLEEPPAGTLLILVATHLSRLPMTIRSRCTRIAFGPPSNAMALAWMRSQVTSPNPESLLAHAGGAPLLAALLAEEDLASSQSRLTSDLAQLARGKLDPVACAEQWKSVGYDFCLDLLQRYVVELIKLQSGGLSEQSLAPPDKNSKMFTISIIDLFDFIDKVSIARRQLGSGADETLMLENLLIHWSEIAAGGSRN
jgi:DNA polymerase-3 subunit delta'